MATKLLDRHTRLVKQIELLEKQISDASPGIDKKEKDFNYQQWVRKWRTTKSKDLQKVLSESTRGKTEGSLSIGLVGRYFTDPKKLLKKLKDQQAFYEKNLGTKYAKDTDFIKGISSGSNLRKAAFNTINPNYDRRFDKEIFYKERELEIQAQNKFKQENRETWHENYDDPYKGWRQHLDVSHSQHPKSVNKSPQNNALKISASDRDNVTPVTESGSTYTPEISRHGLTGNVDLGAERWTGRGSGRTFHQANADTRALLIKETNNERAVNMLSNDQLSRFRISGHTGKSADSLYIGSGGDRKRIKIL